MCQVNEDELLDGFTLCDYGWIANAFSERQFLLTSVIVLGPSYFLRILNMSLKLLITAIDVDFGL